MTPKYKPGDVVYKYDIGEVACEIEQYEICSEGEASPVFLYPFFKYQAKKNGDSTEHTLAEAVLFPSEEAARAAMLQRIKEDKQHHVAEILDAACRISVAHQEIERLDYLLYKYESPERVLTNEQ